jgi:hypothetical protein
VNLGERVAARHFRWLRRHGRATADGRLTTFAGRLALLRDVVVDFSRCAGRPGGEPLEGLGWMDKHEEEYRFQPGFLRLPGTQMPTISWRQPRLDRPQLHALLSALANDGDVGAAPADPTPHLLVLRDEYANVFHVMAD